MSIFVNWLVVGCIWIVLFLYNYLFVIEILRVYKMLKNCKKYLYIFIYFVMWRIGDILRMIIFWVWGLGNFNKLNVKYY